MITWANDQIGSTLKDEDLPQSLKTLNIAVENLYVDTDGKLDIRVQVGKEDANKKWDASWKPITDLAFDLSAVTLEFHRA